MADVHLVETGTKGIKDKDVTKEAKEALRIRVEELKRLNAVLLAENGMYEQFISRLDPHELLLAEQQKTKREGSRWRKKSQPEPQLTLQQKCYVARSEVMEAQNEQKKMRHKYEKIHDHFRDSMKEAEIRLDDIRKEKADFERRLVKPLKQNRLDRHKLDVLRCIKDKSKMNQMEMCSLKTQSLRVKEKKLQQQLQQQLQLQQRKDLGKAGSEEFLEDFNEEHSDLNLDEVRAKNIKTQHVLNSYKDKLQRATSELSNLHKEITEKEQKVARLEESIRHAEEEHLKAQLINEHLQSQIADYKAPDSNEYMLMKEKNRKLQNTVLTWERKVGVAEMVLKSYRKSSLKQRATFTPVNSAETRAWSGGHQFSGKLPDITEHKITVNKYV